jgi:phospholipase C
MLTITLASSTLPAALAGNARETYMGMENIEHVVVVMFENRSFDSLLGWLYDNETDPPKLNIPAQTPPTFEGLTANAWSNQLTAPGSPKVFASRPTTAWPSCPNANQIPTPDPNEGFANVTFQLFGKSSPNPGDRADMSGFLQDYSTTDAGTASAGQIMQTYGPDQASVINSIARNFAVCDHWFASVPSQTWPNRGFVHTGSSDGHINNDSYEWYSIPTIFNILEAQRKSWGVYYDADLIPSLTYWQFPMLGGLRGNFFNYSAFQQLCKAQPDADPSVKLPAYSFIEPRFVVEELGLAQPSDYHPPHNICRGEQFLAGVYQAVRNSPYRDNIMLVILFDEHGGCFDHVPPPTGAGAPQPWPVSRDGSFNFSRFGVRVPAIVVSSYVEPGTVFRAADGATPFDHTSILATLRDWLNLAATGQQFLQSPRIAAAPTLDQVLIRTKGNENTAWPDIAATCTVDASDTSPDTPLNDVQKSLLVGAQVLNNTDHPTVVAQQVQQQASTYAHGATLLMQRATT